MKNLLPLLEQLIPALLRLDARLEAAAAGTSPVALDPFHGLHVSAAEVERLLRLPPAAPRHAAAQITTPSPAAGPLAWLRDTFSLTSFDLDLLLLALAPELDRRYERVYAFLQDHVARRRPTVDLALHLLCADAAERLARRAHFAPEAPLFRHGLLHLLPAGEDGFDSLLSHALRPDEQVTALLLGETTVDRRLGRWSATRPPATSESAAASPPDPALAALLAEARAANVGFYVYAHGPADTGRRRLAHQVADSLELPILQVEVPRLMAESSDPGAALGIALRQARFQRRLLLLHDIDSLAAHPILWPAVSAAMATTPLLLWATGRSNHVPATAAAVAWRPVLCATPPYDRRRTLWSAAATRQRLAVDEETIDTVAARFRLGPGQIDRAAGTARRAAEWRHRRLAPDEALPLALEDLQAAARAHSGRGLGNLAQKIEPHHAWEDIVLPEDALAQLREICLRVTYRHQVLHRWGFGARLGQATGVNVLFAGPSGTGKTMAAEIVARELGLELYRIDLSGVVSKYIGETEKNLEQLFAAAENSNAILFFDEADALFGKRSEVRDAHDRYANIEISYLLQRMETYQGLTILATNLRHHLDGAFARRMAATVFFPFPDAASRAAIWRQVWPAETPLAPDLDLAELAEAHRLSGGHIRNVALAAAFLAAADGDTVGTSHVARALAREYEKMGRRQPADEPPASTVKANGRGTP